MRRGPTDTGKGTAEQEQQRGGTQVMEVEEVASRKMEGGRVKPRQGQLKKSAMEQSGEREVLD